MVLSIEDVAVERDDVLQQIREVNLSYLLLAQRMACQDKATAIYRLGISTELADILANLSPHQVIRIAASNQMLLDFRFSSNEAGLAQITKESLFSGLNRTHAAIMMAAMPVEDIN